MPEVGGSKSKSMFSRRMLTEHLREEFCAEFIVLLLREVIMGRDWRVTLRDINPATGRPRDGRPSKATMPEQVPSLETSFYAFKEMLLRRDGAPAQQIQLDANVQARVASLSAQVDLGRLAAMTPQERATLRQTLQKLVAPPAEDPDSKTLPQGTPEVPAGITPGDAVLAGPGEADHAKSGA